MPRGPEGEKCERRYPAVAAAGRILRATYMPLDQTDFSVVIKNSAPQPKPWRWEIYRTGRKSAIECSPILYETVEAANSAGRKALKKLLTEFPD